MTVVVTNRILLAATNSDVIENLKDTLAELSHALFCETKLLALQNSVRINRPDLAVYCADLAKERLSEIARSITEERCAQLIVFDDSQDIDYSLVKPGIDVIRLPQEQALLSARTQHLLSQKAFQDLAENSLVGHVDPLSGLYNRRMLYEVGEKELNRCQRYERPFSLVTLRLNELKDVNMRFGYRAGDALIHHISTSILGRIRQSDLLARLGDSEFVILLPECHIEHCEQKVRELSQLLKQIHPEFEGQKIPFTVLAGVAEMDTGDVVLEQIIQRSNLELEMIA